MELQKIIRRRVISPYKMQGIVPPIKRCFKFWIRPSQEYPYSLV
jgi:hypothetical protein